MVKGGAGGVMVHFFTPVMCKFEGRKEGGKEGRKDVEGR
jgi:hypothetical protein